MLAIQLCMLVFPAYVTGQKASAIGGLRVRHQAVHRSTVVAEPSEKRTDMPTKTPGRLVRHLAVALSIAIGSGCATAPAPSDTESYAEQGDQ